MAKMISVAFRTADQELEDLIDLEFEKEEKLFTNRFTTESLTTVVLTATRDSIEKLWRFFSRHRQGFTLALLYTVSGKRISLMEYEDHEIAWLDTLVQS